MKYTINTRASTSIAQTLQAIGKEYDIGQRDKRIDRSPFERLGILDTFENVFKAVVRAVS